ncbi:hypothetical protein ACM55F_10155 [Flavobacterium sp. XS2P12]|uniref:hypothetical protein n=1 Tax=Flavobacterium melibiosi TaxID=3398734 RepID=UPI003A8A43F6
MNHQEFYEQRKEAIQARSQELKLQKTPKLTRDQRLDIIQAEHGISHGTIKQILSNSSYQKPLPKSVKNT